MRNQQNKYIEHYVVVANPDERVIKFFDDPMDAFEYTADAAEKGFTGIDVLKVLQDGTFTAVDFTAVDDTRDA